MNGDMEFMRDLEARYRVTSGLEDRSRYKIYYGPVRPADILLLGINPGGKPAEIMPDGRHSTDGVPMHAASATYYENDESDLLDCDWTENRGLLKVLLPLMDSDREAVRRRVVKTNVAFIRSPKVVNVDIESAKVAAAPFLQEIIGRVRPSLVLLAGVKIDDFAGRYCSGIEPLGEVIRDDRVKKTVFRGARVVLRATSESALVIELAHASQFNWTYERYGVVERIRDLWCSDPQTSGAATPATDRGTLARSLLL